MYNYYNSTFYIQTAQRAKREGCRVARDYGYYVRVSPPNFECSKYKGAESLESWCKTKQIAEKVAEDKRNSQRKGYYSCPCGSNKQARGCCGTPATK